jgi:hypothetical protein
MTEQGELIAQSGELVAQIDDRDLAQLLAFLELDGGPATDETLMAWLEGGAGEMALDFQGRRIGVQRIAKPELPVRFGYVQAPA